MGGSISDIEPLLSSNGPQDLIDQLSTLGTLGAQNSVALDRFKVAEEEARKAKRLPMMQKRFNKLQHKKLLHAKKVADDAKAEQAKEVAKLQKVQDELMRQLMSARKVRTTLEQQRQLALLEESQASTAAQTGGQKSVWPDRGFKGRSTIRTTQAQRDKAVAFAKDSQVLARKPYVWGTQGPNYI
jgi:peptidoglycan DL-endopeptidase CwlO